MAVGTTGTIPARTIVDVHSRLITPGGSDLVFNGVLINSNPSVPITGDVLIFNSAATVGAYFGPDSFEYEAAKIYFRGYDNAPIRPKALVIARRIVSDESGYLMTGALGMTLAEMASMNEADFTLNINNIERNVSFDLSGVTSFSEAGKRIADAITAAFSGEAFWPKDGETSMRYYSHLKKYVIQLPGAGMSIQYASSDILKMTAETGAFISAAAEVMSVNQTMEMIRGVTTNWVCFTTSEEPNLEEMKQYAVWSTGQEDGYEYVPWTISAMASMQGNKNDPASVLEEANVSGTARPIYGDLPYAMFLMGAIGSIDWDRTNAMITMAFKAQTGLPANVTSLEEYEVLVEQKKYNIYGTWATRNDKFTWLYKGSQFGAYKSIDAWLGNIYLTNSIQVALMHGLSQTGRLSYTEAGGYARINAWISSVFRKGRSNGTVDVGVTVSQTQKSQIIEEAGRDITQELFQNGFYVQVLDPGAVARYESESPIVNAWYTYGGSILKISVPVSTTL